MRSEREEKEKTDKIHSMICTICDYLTTDYKSKKHGGYNYYTDNKITMNQDTYVSNVECFVKLPNDKQEEVFSCDYKGYSVTYHPGKWYNYLLNLYSKALVAKTKKIEEQELKEKEEEDKKRAPCTEEANKVFKD